MMTTKEQLLDWRLNIGQRTQVEMSVLLGVSEKTYRRLEKGEWPILKLHSLALETVFRNFKG